MMLKDIIVLNEECGDFDPHACPICGAAKKSASAICYRCRDRGLTPDGPKKTRPWREGVVAHEWNGVGSPGSEAALAAIEEAKKIMAISNSPRKHKRLSKTAIARMTAAKRADRVEVWGAFQ